MRRTDSFKNFTLFFPILFLFICCSSEPILTSYELNDEYIWEVTLSPKWKALSDAQRKDIEQRGDKVIQKSGRNVNKDGFRDILMLDYNGSKFIAAIGLIEADKFGPYERARQQRAEFYKNMFNRKEIEDVEMVEKEVRLGEVTLMNYQINARTEAVPIFGSQSVYNHLYEGKLNEEEFILITTISTDSDLNTELIQMVSESKILQLN